MHSIDRHPEIGMVSHTYLYALHVLSVIPPLTWRLVNHPGSIMNLSSLHGLRCVLVSPCQPLTKRDTSCGGNIKVIQWSDLWLTFYSHASKSVIFFNISKSKLCNNFGIILEISIKLSKTFASHRISMCSIKRDSNMVTWILDTIYCNLKYPTSIRTRINNLLLQTYK